MIATPFPSYRYHAYQGGHVSQFEERCLTVKRVSERPDHREENCRLVDAPCCWPGGSFGVCRKKLLGAVDTRRYPRAENRVWSDQEDHEERGSKDRAASTCGPHSDSFNNTSRWAIFQQDNARPHTARVAQDFLRHFQTLARPASPPDLSPVEHVWDQLKRQMPSCHSAHDSELAIQDLWAHLPQDNIRCLINSMPDRVAACIAAEGGQTRY
ncbi:transposable element Tcb2 transposase [Trichonephila clavipes]|nr:transposable element Tcb2 transposase [Trichonephila clavipes]